MNSTPTSTKDNSGLCTSIKCIKDGSERQVYESKKQHDSFKLCLGHMLVLWRDAQEGAVHVLECSARELVLVLQLHLEGTGDTKRPLVNRTRKEGATGKYTHAPAVFVLTLGCWSAWQQLTALSGTRPCRRTCQFPFWQQGGQTCWRSGATGVRVCRPCWPVTRA